MDTNPYLPPAADVDDVSPAGAKPHIPPRILKSIRNAWIAALIYSLIAFIGWLPNAVRTMANMSAASSSVLLHFLISSVLLILFFSVTYGIYRKSRVCALITAIFIVSASILHVYSNFSSGNISNPAAQSAGYRFGMITAALLFSYFLIKGAIGTFTYHKLRKDLNT